MIKVCTVRATLVCLLLRKYWKIYLYKTLRAYVYKKYTSHKYSSIFFSDTDTEEEP